VSSSPLWWFWERFTDVHTAAYKISHGRLGGRAYGVPVVLIESVGRKTGKHRTHPLLCLPDGERLVIIASKGGTDRHPAWYHNLVAHPETTAWWKGEKRRVRAREASGEERERLWRMMANAYPDYENYQRRTDRQIPVVVLEPVA
jgi:deazaflavin-dependent oxidoreductase (nitroreductase family)